MAENIKIFDSIFRPLPHQEPLCLEMRTKKRAVAVYHRRGGKDITCWNILLEKAFEKVGVYYYIFPSYAQARKAFWDNITEDGMSYLDYIPSPLLAKKWQNEMKLKLINGSIIQVLGSDYSDGLRGTNPSGVVLSEYAYQNPRIWTAILDPILQKNKGWAIFNSTPSGKNHFYDLYEYAKTNNEWYAGLYDIKATGLISEEEMANKEAQGLSQEMLQQEYFCSFSAGVIGSYYGRYLETAYAEGRVGHVPYDDRYLVNTAWDIGFSDSTSIVFFQKVASKINVIDYYENNGFALSHYLNHLRSLPYQYGINYLPHDGRNRSVATGKSLFQIASDTEFNFELIPNKYGIMEGIEIVRGLFKRFFFDEKKCELLLRCLQEYHADYNELAQVYSNKPKHNWASHAADSVRYMSLTVNGLKNGLMTEDDALKMENLYKKNFSAFH